MAVSAMNLTLCAGGVVYPNAFEVLMNAQQQLSLKKLPDPKDRKTGTDERLFG